VLKTKICWAQTYKCSVPFISLALDHVCLKLQFSTLLVYTITYFSDCSILYKKSSMLKQINSHCPCVSACKCNQYENT
jgi:hypothetical protein